MFARKTRVSYKVMVFFSHFQVDDQMKLLQNSWSEMLIMDQIHQRMHNHLPDETTLPNGQKFELLSLALLGVPSMLDAFQEITAKLTALKFDSADYVCLKFILLLNPGTNTLGFTFCKKKSLKFKKLKN